MKVELLQENKEMDLESLKITNYIPLFIIAWLLPLICCAFAAACDKLLSGVVPYDKFWYAMFGMAALIGVFAEQISASFPVIVMNVVASAVVLVLNFFEFSSQKNKAKRAWAKMLSGLHGLLVCWVVFSWLI